MASGGIFAAEDVDPFVGRRDDGKLALKDVEKSRRTLGRRRSSTEGLGSSRQNGIRFFEIRNASGSLLKHFAFD